MHASIAFNPVYTGDVLVLGAFIQDNTGSGAGTPDAGFTLGERFYKVANGWQFSLLYLEEVNGGSYTPGITAAVGSGGWGAAAVALQEAAAPPPPEIELRICEPDGTGCVLIERAIDKKIRFDFNGTGAGYFAISRYDVQATAANLRQGNILQFTFPEIDPGVLGECILETGDFALVDSDEEGGEILGFGGKGTLGLLSHTLLDNHWNDTSHPDLRVLSEGLWRWPASITNATAAGILRRIIVESQMHSPPALADVTRDWSDTTDSEGNPFYDMDGIWEITIGTDLLTAGMKLAQAGLFQLEMRPGFLLRCYDDQGTDRSSATFAAGKVRFEKGVNIATDLSRQMHGKNYASAVFLHTKRGYLWVYPVGTPYYIKEKYLDLSQTSGTSDAARAAARAILRGVEELDGILLPVTPTGPNFEENDDLSGWYYPGFEGTANGKYWLGDLVTLHTGTDETDYDNATLRVQAITLYEDETGSLAPPIVELNAQWQDTTPGAGSGSPVSEGGSGSGGSTGGPVNSPHVHSQYQVAAVDRWKQPVRVATTGNVTIATALNAGDAIDGVTLVEGDRVLVRAQTTGSQNGIYEVGPSPARAPDFTEDEDVLGSFVAVVEGSTLAGKVYRLDNTTLPDIGTTALVFEEFGTIVASLDDLTDVVLTSPASADRLRFDGSVWRNSALTWKPVMDGSGNVVTDSGTGEAIVTEVIP